MSRYIDADKVLMALRLDHKDVIYIDKRDTAKRIEKIQGIDIVRCKECKFCLVGVATAQYSNGKQRIENLCEKHKWSVRADDFCSYGERRE